MATEVISREAQREYPRFPVAATKAVRIDLGPAGAGQLVDISGSGMRIKSVAPLRRDAELPLHIHVPDKSVPVECSGVVVWSKPTGAAGLRFTKMSDEHKAVLTAWLAELESAASETSAQRDEFTRITAQVRAMKLNNADALNLIVRRIAQLSGADGVAIALGKPENMICLARNGEAPELGTVIRPGEGLTGECLRSRKLVHCLDAATDPRGFELKCGSAVILPLLVNTELRGVVQVFSARPNAFDANCLVTIEKLADAVVFVTHNTMPQRRLSIVSPQLKPASSEPAISKPSDSSTITALPATPKPLATVTPIVRPTPAGPQPIASTPSVVIPVAPLAAPIQTQGTPPFTAAKPTPVVPRAESAGSQLPVYHPRPYPTSGKLKLAIPVIILLVAILCGLYFWMRQLPATVATAAQASSLVAPASQPAETTVAVTPAESAPVAQPRVAQVASAPASPVAAASIVKQIPVTEVAAPVKKAAAEKQPEPTPIVLAASIPADHAKRTEELDLPAPSAAAIPMRTTAAIPGFDLPSNSAAPKLTAPVAKTLTGGTVLQRIAPVYPRAAISQGIEGTVELQAVITSKGTVEQVRRLNGHPLLVQAAIDAVKRWRYEPFRSNGEPIDREATISLNFKIPR